MCCDDYDESGTSCLVQGTGPCCSVCGCSLKLMLRSLDSACHKGHWGAESKDDNNGKAQFA